ncbi:hypothetical protein V492_06029 [Pseudogymnoascus sp. VKM F-4246]|nr:hypothetical protein V492_06029 [Pseudogymnoascus sp. VKM F-4246]
MSISTKELESQKESGTDLQALENPAADIIATSETEAPCVGSGTEKQIPSHVVATSTPNEHAVPWPHVEPWRRNVALAGIFAGVFFSTLDTTIIGTALVSIVEELGSFWLSPWIVLAYLLTYMSFAMAIARLSDIYGRKPVVLVSWGLFMVFSLACALSQTIRQLIVFRAFQGLGGAGLYSMGMVMIAEVLDPSKFAAGAAWIGLTVGGSGVLGPILGGAISNQSTWRWIFYMNLPFSAIAMASIFFVWPASAKPSQSSKWHTFLSIDFVGVLFMMGGSVCLVYGLQRATTGSRPWDEPVVVTCLVLSGVFWLAFFTWEGLLGARSWLNIDPIFPMHILKRRVMAAAFASIFCTGFPLVTATILLPERFQLVNGSSPLKAGLSLLPLAAATGFGSFVGGAISSARNLTSPTLIAGSSLQLFGLGLLTTIPDTLSIPHYLYGLEVLLGLGVGMCLSAGTLMVTLNSKLGEIAATQGATAQLRPLGGFIGLTVATALFNSRSESELGAFLSAEQMDALHRSPLGALSFDPDVLATAPGHITDVPLLRHTRKKVNATHKRAYSLLTSTSIMHPYDHVDDQGEDILLGSVLHTDNPTTKEVTSDQPSSSLLQEEHNEDGSVEGGRDKDDRAQKHSETSIATYYAKVVYWGAFRWIVSWVVFGTAVRIVSARSVPVIVPYGAFNLASACVNIILMGPLLRHSASATNPRPPTLWLARQAVLIALWIASVGTSIAMVVMTYEYRKEKDPSGKMCSGTKTGRHRCESERASIHMACIFSLVGAAGTLFACILQLWLALRVNRTRFTEHEIKGAYEYTMRVQAQVKTSEAWKDVYRGIMNIPRSFKEGWDQGRRP